MKDTVPRVDQLARMGFSAEQHRGPLGRHHRPSGSPVSPPGHKVACGRCREEFPPEEICLCESDHPTFLRVLCDGCRTSADFVVQRGSRWTHRSVGRGPHED